MSKFKLDNETEIDPSTIESVKFDRKGAKITEGAINTAVGIREDLTVPEDVLIVRLNDGSELAVRGAQAHSAYESLRKLQQDEKLSVKIDEAR